MVEIESQKIPKETLLNKIETIANTHKKRAAAIKENPARNITKEEKSVYIVNDFTKFHDEEFIKNLYLGVLKREVDLVSLNHYLNMLRSGKRSKTEILATIRFSKEGRLKNVPILGIKKRYIMAVVYKTPFIGYIAKTVVTLLTLPKMIEKSNRFEAYYFAHQKLMQSDIDKKVNLSDFHTEIGTIQNEIGTIQNEIGTIQNEIGKKVNLTDFHKDMHAMQSLLTQKHFELKNQTELYIKDVNSAKSYLRDVEKNLKGLIEKAEYSINTADREIINGIIKEKEHMLDTLYVAFEDRFRGSREDIKARQNYYLPLVSEVVRSEKDLVVDVGCGRGEWIELLKENSINARGIDLNRLMVSESIGYGLDALNMDAIAYLKSLQDESLAVITGFHIVEHLPFEVLILLFDEAYRVLRKNGMIIFETPNPENIMVGSCSFYTDPTHMNPIPPVTLEFLAQNRGFSDVKIHRLHPIKEASFIEGENREDINNLIFASVKEQDYSVVGYKI